MYLVRIGNNKITGKQCTSNSFEVPEGMKEITREQFDSIIRLPADVTLSPKGDILSITNAPEPPEYESIEEINEAVVKKIKLHYDSNEEAKMLRLGILDSENEDFIAYNNYIEECRTWGQNKKID